MLSRWRESEEKTLTKKYRSDSFAMWRSLLRCKAVYWCKMLPIYLVHSVLWSLNSKLAAYIYCRTLYTCINVEMYISNVVFSRKLATHKCELSLWVDVVAAAGATATFRRELSDLRFGTICIVYFYLRYVCFFSRRLAMVTNVSSGCSHSNGTGKGKSKTKHSIQLCHCIFIPQCCRTEHTQAKVKW